MMLVCEDAEVADGSPVLRFEAWPYPAEHTSQAIYHPRTSRMCVILGETFLRFVITQWS